MSVDGDSLELGPLSVDPSISTTTKTGLCRALSMFGIAWRAS